MIIVAWYPLIHWQEASKRFFLDSNPIIIDVPSFIAWWVSFLIICIFCCTTDWLLSKCRVNFEASKRFFLDDYAIIIDVPCFIVARWVSFLIICAFCCTKDWFLSKCTVNFGCSPLLGCLIKYSCIGFKEYFFRKICYFRDYLIEVTDSKISTQEVARTSTNFSRSWFICF